MKTPRDPHFAVTIVARDGACQECGSNMQLQAHHIIPVSEGGNDELDNGITLCAECHATMHPDVPRRLFVTQAAGQHNPKRWNASSLAAFLGCHPRTVKRTAKKLGMTRRYITWGFDEDEATAISKTISKFNRRPDDPQQKRWPFQATEDDKRLIDRINAARPLDRTSVADAIRYALRFTVANDKEINGMTIERILYQYGEDDAAMFGGDAELDGVDIPSSYDMYDVAIRETLEAAYPGTRVSVSRGADWLRIDGMSDHEEAPYIADVIHEIWAEFDWVVEK